MTLRTSCLVPVEHLKNIENGPPSGIRWQPAIRCCNPPGRKDESPLDHAAVPSLLADLDLLFTGHLGIVKRLVLQHRERKQGDAQHQGTTN